MTRLPILFLLSVANLLSASAATAQSLDPAEVADEVRRLTVDAGAAVRVDGFRLKAGPATVVLAEGTLVPSTPVAGRPVEFVFLGQGRIELEAPDDVEAGQLELFTGSSHLDESFERAVFVVALDAAADALIRRPPDDESAQIARASGLLADWQRGPERKLLDVEARIFADGVGDPLAAGYFCAYLEGRTLGRFLYLVDPLADEQVTLGQFVRSELSRRQERSARRSIEEAQRRGKLIGLEVADLGIWDTWLSSSLEAPDGTPTPGARGVEPEHYDLEVNLGGKDLELDGSVRLSLRVVVDGLRAVAFEMSPDLEPIRVTDAAGRELAWFRSRNELVAVMSEAARSGATVEVTISYAGTPLEKVASGAFVQSDTTGWYPHAGTVDRATYTATLEWPDRLELVAPGAVEEEGIGDGGLRWRRLRLDRPTLGYSFEVGTFDSAAGRAGDVAVTVWVDRLGSEVDQGLATDILATAVDVMDYYGQVFGPYPLDNLRLVSSPRGFSQGLLGFVTLSTSAVVDWEEWGSLLGFEDRRTVIAHEVAHQWWGNLVGWRSYRDQWISEAMANYAALLYARNRLAGRGDARLSRGPTAGWQSELLRSTRDGRPIESLGPLVMGARLDSSISTAAYPAIVYKKGAVVLDMLARYFSEDVFLAILREIVDAASGSVITSDDFVRGIGRLGGTDLSWFLRQYIRGTGLPEIAYSCGFERLDDGRWAVVGEARQRAPNDFRYAVVEKSFGALDVERRAFRRLDVADSVIVVPFQIGVAGGSANPGDPRTMLEGRVVIEGEVSPFRLELEATPEIFWLDRDSQVFGRFYDSDRWPRRSAYQRGLDQAAAGDPAAARTSFETALAAEVAVIPAGWESFFRPFDVDTEGERLDARILLAVARLDLDAGRLGDARAELVRATDLVKGQDRWFLGAELLAVESRLDLLSGDARSAYRRLRKEVLGRGGVDRPETWALLAIAARVTGNTSELERAATRAAELGVDLGPLAARASRP